MITVTSAATTGQPDSRRAAATLAVLLAISSAHMLNDAMQAVVVAMFPILEQALRLTFTQLGWLSFALNMTSSVLQPLVGQLSDRTPFPRLLPVAMLSTLAGLVGLGLAAHFWVLVVAVVVIGLGSAVFHPEGSRIVYYAAGERRSFAQSVYQVGGNFGQSLAPVMTMLVFVPLGQRGAIWTGLVALVAFAVLLGIVPWYRAQLAAHRMGAPAADRRPQASNLAAAGLPAVSRPDRRTVVRGVALLLALAMARSWYWAGMASYFQFYAMEKFALSIQGAQVPVLVFMVAGVVGTLAGGLLGDRVGPRAMMLFSIAAAVPLALALPYAPLVGVYLVMALIGFIIQSGFSVSVVYAQELMPDQVGTASGLIVGLAFGAGALGAVAFGRASDLWGVVPVLDHLGYVLLPGLLAFGLPRIGGQRQA